MNKSEIPFYDPIAIESKWQSAWEKDELYRSKVEKSKPKFYALTMLPYPSGDLHIGHWYAMVPSDARARFKRMNGFNVLFPMGFDAFGLPAENAAIKKNIHPKQWTYQNIERMRGQLKMMGSMYDWKREAISADPKYYRWTQFFFSQFFKNGLAYRKKSPVDWCPNCNTTLAREQVIGDDRHCERCKTPVIKKDLTQWFFRITKYADELLDFSQLDWPERVKALESNWIGRSVGASVNFQTQYGDQLEVFTTRPDTLWGVTFMVIAPEHPLVQKISKPENQASISSYVACATRQSDIERESADKEKTGVFTGSYAINPVNQERIPIWIADYVMMTYGTGAIMAVPAHDQRDFEFAKKYNLPIRVVIQPQGSPDIQTDQITSAIPATGRMVNSGQLSGTSGENAFQAAVEHIERSGIGKISVNYRIRDWLISRQRYWGAPIPIIYCLKCGEVAVPDEQLPVLLPDDVKWKPTGESPLKLHPTWRFTTCPNCGGQAERETDTMDTFMCSSWYHLRYLSPEYSKAPFDPDEYAYWMPVDTYTGGIEHANMHLIYTRFFHKACRDCDLLTGDEPMLQLRNQGIILGEDSEKMSKSRGNVSAPDELVESFGADSVRAYLMFFARWEQGAPWSSSGLEGTHRWIKRIWALFLEENLEGDPTPEVIKNLRRKVHQTLRSVSADFENFQFNTIVSGLMELLNEMTHAKQKGAYGTEAWSEAVVIYLHMLAPVAPHVSEELWHLLGHEGSIHLSHWPAVDEDAAREDLVTLVIQINGKVRDRLDVPLSITEEEAKAKALQNEIVLKLLAGTEPRKVIYVKGRLINIVT